MKIALVFPGQGSQYAGMGKDLFDCSSEAQQIFSKADEVLGYNISTICFNGPEQQLRKTSIAQPAILTTSIACLMEFKKHCKAKIEMVAGHSLGEYSALVAAGCIDFVQALKLVEKRGLFMEEAASSGGGMSAVLGLERTLVDKACDEASEAGKVEVANYNCPGQIVISGEDKGLQKATELCKEYGAKRVIPLAVSGPFHSSLMIPAGNKLSKEMQVIQWQSPQIPFINNVDAEFITEAEKIHTSLTKQVSSSVLWEDIIRKMIDKGVDTFVEIGPGKVLSGLIKKINKGCNVLSVEDTASLENSLAKIEEVI